MNVAQVGDSPEKIHTCTPFAATNCVGWCWFCLGCFWLCWLLGFRVCCSHVLLDVEVYCKFVFCFRLLQFSEVVELAPDCVSFFGNSFVVT